MKKIMVRLDGGDYGWTMIEQFEKEYRQLGNGEYTFYVKLEGEDDQASIYPVKIIISEPWYQLIVDFWVYILLVLTFILMLVFLLTYRFRISKRVLTRMVTEKTKAIEEHKVELLKMNERVMTYYETYTYVYKQNHYFT